jgi:DNA topoisomerase VI subunit B
MARQSPDAAGPAIFEVELQFSPRLVCEHLGTNKYASSTQALAELVANGLDAGAMLVDVDVETNEFGGVLSITISDNGCGMTAKVIEERFGQWVFCQYRAPGL